MIAVFQPNEYYASHAAYLEALAEAKRPKYEAIAESGLILQVDCPDLAMAGTSSYVVSTMMGFCETRLCRWSP